MRGLLKVSATKTRKGTLVSDMRTLSSSEVTDAVEKLIYRASYYIGQDIKYALGVSKDKESFPLARQVIEQLETNYQIASEEKIAICQDTGMCIVFCEIGQDVHIEGDYFEDAVNEGVRRAYRFGSLRKSIVSDPLYERINTNDNTPAVIHTRIVPGDRLLLKVICKGFGSENMSRIKMLVPADGEQGVIDFVVDTVRHADANPCPPVILGVCIGGDFEQAALYAKLMTAGRMDEMNSDERYAALEKKLLDKINELNIGPAGFGGDTTCLKVNVCALPTHIAGMPVAVNVCCHAARHAEMSI